MGSVLPFDSRIATRARIRNDARSAKVCDIHGSTGCRYCREVTRAWADPQDVRYRRVEGHIPEGYVPDDWTEALMPKTPAYAVGMVLALCVGVALLVWAGGWLVGLAVG